MSDPNDPLYQMKKRVIETMWKRKQKLLSMDLLKGAKESVLWYLLDLADGRKYEPREPEITTHEQAARKAQQHKRVEKHFTSYKDRK